VAKIVQRQVPIDAGVFSIVFAMPRCEALRSTTGRRIGAPNVVKLREGRGEL
jgi:hypothetical protein